METESETAIARWDFQYGEENMGSDRLRVFGERGRVIFAGRREDVHTMLRALDVFPLPSYTEGLSISLLEAASAGLPIVATAVGGNVEAIKDARNSLLVPPGGPIALARGLERMLDHSGEVLKMGRRAAVTVRSDYSLEEMVRSVEDVYAKFLEKARRKDTSHRASPETMSRWMKYARRETDAGAQSMVQQQPG